MVIVIIQMDKDESFIQWEPKLVFDTVRWDFL